MLGNADIDWLVGMDPIEADAILNSLAKPARIRP
jgi:hypothetical protein